MGRGRVELKRIENKINRQVTFAKRRNGLLKKAYELSILCDAEVALIIFSNRGKLYEFSSTSNMLKTLERYQKCSYGTVECNNRGREMEQTSFREYLKLKGKHEELQQYQRQLLGEDLDPLNMKELEHLEHLLDSSLKHIRSTKTQTMLDQLYDLQTKEKMWVEANKALEDKLGEIYRDNQVHSSWGGGGQCSSYDPHQHAQSQGFFQAFECDSTLQIGYNSEVSNQIRVAPQQDQNGNAIIPGWML
uniref:SEPALLATA 4 n=1 Tax=Primula vulgaris TaxID=175104 RepID=A0A3T0QHJ8_9ERIC|nr:SEPALLATA 4 [Primula vulgaris]